eukprot:scaffold6847_cov71-Cylindrotheca_fusiformis.AAC.2
MGRFSRALPLGRKNDDQEVSFVCKQELQLGTVNAVENEKMAYIVAPGNKTSFVKAVYKQVCQQRLRWFHNTPRNN